MRREALNVCNMRLTSNERYHISLSKIMYFCHSDKTSHGNQVGLSLGSRNLSVQTVGESKESGCQTCETQTTAECESPATTATATDHLAKSLKVSNNRTRECSHHAFFRCK